MVTQYLEIFQILVFFCKAKGQTLIPVWYICLSLNPFLNLLSRSCIPKQNLGLSLVSTKYA